MPSADVNVAALQQLEAALHRHIASVDGAVRAISLDFDRRVEGIARWERDARDEVARCADSLSAADDDDVEAARDALEEARENLQRASTWRRRVDAKAAAFAAAARRHRAVIDDEVGRGFVILGSSIALLREYSSIRPGDTAETAPSSEPATVVTTPMQAVAVHHTPLSEAPLPRGFAWMPLAQIDQGELDNPESPVDFVKVSHAEMTAGFAALREQILPRLAARPGENLEEMFRDIDRQAGVDYANGLQRVYESFFGAHDFVYVTRSRQDSKFTITNGRHRIMVARELGWDAIPVKFKDLRGG